MAEYLTNYFGDLTKKFDDKVVRKKGEEGAFEKKQVGNRGKDFGTYRGNQSPGKVD